jgi:glycosyltransferase involved in cell wall biosynthesis
MALARPVVATTVGGVPEVVTEGVTGRLVEPGDVAGLAEAVSRLLSDPSLAEAMGEAGRRRAEEAFDIRRMVVELEQLYGEIANGARNGARRGTRSGARPG